MIQKKIHYIWLGGKQKSKLTEICINSWKRVLPDYEIIEWNENNLEIEELCKENRFFKKCYELKLWAFVSDYIRLYVLYKYGISNAGTISPRVEAASIIPAQYPRMVSFHL